MRNAENGKWAPPQKWLHVMTEVAVPEWVLPANTKVGSSEALCAPLTQRKARIGSLVWERDTLSKEDMGHQVTHWGSLE